MVLSINSRLSPLRLPVSRKRIDHETITCKSDFIPFHPKKLPLAFSSPTRCHWISTASQWWCQYIANKRHRQKIRGNASSDFASFTAYELSQAWKWICTSGINVKIENFNACCRNLGPFASTVGATQALLQLRKLTEIARKPVCVNGRTKKWNRVDRDVGASQTLE